MQRGIQRWRLFAASVALTLSVANSSAAPPAAKAAISNPATNPSTTNPATKETLRELVQVESQATLELLRSQLVRDLRRSVVNVPDAVWRKLESELSLQPMVDDQVRAYERVLSEPEARALIAFFRSPAGQKYLAQQRNETSQREMLSSVQQWAQRAEQRLVGEVQKAGYEVPEEPANTAMPFGARGRYAGMPAQDPAQMAGVPGAFGMGGMPGVGGGMGGSRAGGMPGFPGVGGMPGMPSMPMMPGANPQMPGAGVPGFGR